MDSTDSPLEFPCDFPIKVMGRAEPGFDCDPVEEVTLPAPKLDCQLSVLLESSRMKAHQATIPGFRQ